MVIIMKMSKMIVNGALIITAGAVTLLNGVIIKKELKAINDEKIVLFDPDCFKDVDCSGK